MLGALHNDFFVLFARKKRRNTEHKTLIPAALLLHFFGSQNEFQHMSAQPFHDRFKSKPSAVPQENHWMCQVYDHSFLSWNVSNVHTSFCSAYFRTIYWAWTRNIIHSITCLAFSSDSMFAFFSFVLPGAVLNSIKMTSRSLRITRKENRNVERIDEKMCQLCKAWKIDFITRPLFSHSLRYFGMISFKTHLEGGLPAGVFGTEWCENATSQWTAT